MKINVTYTIEKASFYYERVDGEIIKKSSENTTFSHESLDMNDVCELLSKKYRDENFTADEYVKIECSID